MNWLAPKLNLRVAQKQILTPGLVQMVSVLALNRLELREMINQEMVENPVLEELADDPVVTDDYSDQAFLKAETEKVPAVPTSIDSVTGISSTTSRLMSPLAPLGGPSGSRFSIGAGCTCAFISFLP